MIQRMPDYYTEFHCIASECKHCCCMSWEIEVDESTYNHYKQVEGEFGDQLRNWIKKDKGYKFKMLHGKCPFLTSNQLCNVYLTLGEQAMCKVCTEYPRVEEVYGDVKEYVLALSCEAAGRILFTKKSKIEFIDKDLLEEAAVTTEITETDENKELLNARNQCIHILQDRSHALQDRIACFLAYSSEVQRYMDEERLTELELIRPEYHELQKDTSDEKSKAFKHAFIQQRMDVLMDMEVMEEEWIEELNNVIRMFDADSRRECYYKALADFQADYIEREYEQEHILVYFAYRYLMEAVYDQSFLDKAKFCVMCFLTIRDMDCMKYLMNGSIFTLEDRIEDVRIFCKQVEHSKKCVDYLYEQVKTKDVFAVEALLMQI